MSQSVSRVRQSRSRFLDTIPGGYEVIHVGTSAVSVRTLLRDVGRDESRYYQFGDPVWLPLEGVLRVADAIQKVRQP